MIYSARSRAANPNTPKAEFCGRCNRPLKSKRSTADGFGPVCAEHCIDEYWLAFTISVDTREQTPFTFAGFHCDADRHNKPLLVPTRRETIAAGDYAISGLYLPNGLPPVLIERKSLADLYSTLGQGRDRFQRELELMADCTYPAIVIEATWDEIEFRPPPRSKLHPKTVIRSMLAWSQRYGIHVWAMPGRRAAEKTTLEILRRYWSDNVELNDRITPQEVPSNDAQEDGREVRRTELEGSRT